jgi:DNA-binding MarR family transcriptional regulator
VDARTDKTGSLSTDELAAWRGFLRVHSALFNQLDADLSAAEDLALRSYEVLLLLEDAPQRRLRMSDLSRSVLLSPSGVTRLVDRLEREGLVERERCPEDGRGYNAVLTDAGEARLQRARATHLAGVRRLFLDRLDGDDLVRLAAYWERLVPGAAGTDAEWRRTTPPAQETEWRRATPDPEGGAGA